MPRDSAAYATIPRSTMPALAEVYAEFNELHAKSLRADPGSAEYLALVASMEGIVADVRFAFERQRRRGARADYRVSYET